MEPIQSPKPERGTVLVLGARGRLGALAVQAFAARGWQVLALSRVAGKGPAGVVSIQADVLDQARVLAAVRQAAPQGLDVIVHALNPHYARWDRLLPPLTAAVLTLARATGATVMLPGNVYNFGRQLPEVLDEATPCVADTPKAAQRIALEAELAAAAPQVRSIVIRAGDFIAPDGAGEQTWLRLGLTRQLERGVFSPLGPSGIVHAWAWLPDLAEVFVRVAERRQELSSFTVLHYEGLSLSADQIREALEEQIGRSLRVRPMAWWPLMALGTVVPLLRALVEMRYLWLRPHRLDGQKLQQFLGADLPQTPLAQVLRQALNLRGIRGQA
jgi:nucleoside-diphosphate-sugar epimerase